MTATETSEQDALLPSRELPIRLPVFEGPLDLLLFLIRRNEIDIYDIPIETVTRQYLDILHAMEKMNLDVAGDFFVMAATLMYIKSRMLLPTNEQLTQEEEEVEDADPRWELVQQLLEYKKFKEAAYAFRDMIARQQDFIPRTYKHREEPGSESRPLEASDKISVWNTFNLVLRRLAEKMTTGEIHDEQITLADRMEFLLQHIQTTPRFSFSELFEGSPYHFNKLVATFLAVLELTRLKKCYLTQDANYEEIYIERRDEEDEEDEEEQSGDIKSSSLAED